MNNYLLDIEFLKQLFSAQKRETYARIISLDNEENPREVIEGRVTQGSINLDGKSSVRLSCNLNMVTNNNVAYNDYYWALTTKFKLEIGLKNEVDPKYDEIVYFPKGVYVITNFSMNYGTNGYNISIQGQDKMCLLNGQVSGEIFASTDFGCIEEIDAAGNKTIRDYEIEEIIRESVHKFANEPFHNIIIKDMPKYGLFLLNYKGSEPAYALLNENNKSPANLILNPNTLVYYSPNEDDSYVQVPISSSEIKTFSINELQQDKSQCTKVYMSEPGPDTVNYYVMKIEPGQAAGYKLTSLTYPRNKEDKSSGLVSSVGETLTSILDKIVDMLGDYEYFYNLEGQFVFQKKNKYIDTAWNGNEFNTTGLGNPYVLMASLPNSWNFNNGELVTSYSNSPNLQNIKNDFSIWGTRTNSYGTELPIHLRYAIDKKPEIYTTIKATEEEVQAYKSYWENVENLQPQESETFITEDYVKKYGPIEGARVVDWREIIYRMALDFYKFNHWDGFNLKIMEANGPERYPGGITKYEQYYTDIQGFWRELYDPDEKKSSYLYEKIEYEDIDQADPELLDKLYVKEQYEKSSSATILKYDKYIDTKGPPIVSIDTERSSDYGFRIKFWNNNGNFFEFYSSTLGHSYINSVEVHREDKEKYGKYVAKGGWYVSQFVDTGYSVPYFYDYKDMEVHSSIGAYDYTRTKNYVKNHKYARIVDIIDSTEEKLQYILDNKYEASTSTTKFDEFVKTTRFSYDRVFRIKNIEGKNEYYMFRDQIENPYYIEKIRVIPKRDGVRYYEDETKYIYNGSMLKGENDYIAIYLTKIVTVEDVLNDPSVSYSSGFYNLNPSIPDFTPTDYYITSPWSGPKSFSFINSLSDNAYSLKEIEQAGFLDLYYNTQSEKPLSEYFNFVQRDSFNDPYYIDDEGNKTINVTENGFFYNKQKINYYVKKEIYEDADKWNGNWNKQVADSPETLNFWFDFLDSPESPVGKYGANIIQDRSKAKVEDNAKAIYYRDALNIIYLSDKVEGSEEERRLLPYVDDSYAKFILPSSMMQYFVISNAGKSCKEVLDEYLFNYTYANETVNISAVPIYHLEPGDRITLQDSNTLIGGQYVINSISMPLTYNGTMNINATKAVEKLY